MTTPQPLSKWTKFAFGVGSIGETTYTTIFNAFIVIYYNQAVGLSNSLIGTAILLALVGDAISDPAIGIISDRWRSKLGRRHPFLFVAPIPLAASIWFIFNVPDALTSGDTLNTSSGQFMLFLWLAAWTILSRIFLTLYSIPHIALGGELARDARERSQLFSVNAMLGWSAGALFSFIAWSFFLSGETIGADGVAIPNHLKAASFGPLALFAGALVLITVSMCAIGTFSRIDTLSQPKEDLEPLNIRLFLIKLISPLWNRNYRFLAIGALLFMTSSGLYETFNVFVNTYYWEVVPEQIRWIELAGMPGVIVGAMLAPMLMHKFDRLPVLIGAISCSMISAQVLIDLRLLGWLPENGSELLLPMLITNKFLFLVFIGIASIAVPSMMADIIDENELISGHREEGLFYSTTKFFSKISNSLATLLGGLMLDRFINMPFEAVPGQLDADIINKLGISAGPIMGLFGFFSLFFYIRYSLSRKNHDDILVQLKVRNASNVEAAVAVES